MKNSDLTVTIEMRFDTVIAMRLACEIAHQAINNERYLKSLQASDPTGKTNEAIEALQGILPDMIDAFNHLMNEGFEKIKQGSEIESERFDA